MMIATLHTGSLIEGRYELRRQRPGDGPQVVFDGVDRRTGSPVEIRVVTQACDDDTRQRFGLYAQAVSRLDHPGCVRGHCTGSTPDGSLYLVLDRIARSRLSRRVGTPLDPHHVAAIGAQLLRAMDHARGQGLSVGRIGLEDIEERVEGMRIVVRIVELEGTPTDDEEEARILDTAGAIVRHLVAGCERRLLSEDATPLPVSSADAIEALELSFERLWSDDPSERFASVAGAAEVLEQWCRDDGAGALRAPPPLPSGVGFRTAPTLRTIPVQRRRSRRSPMVAMFGVGVIAIASVGVWAVTRPRATMHAEPVPAAVIPIEPAPVEPEPPVETVEVLEVVEVVEPEVEPPPREADDRPRARTKPTRPTMDARVAAPIEPAPEPPPPPKPEKQDRSIAAPLPNDIKAPTF